MVTVKHFAFTFCAVFALSGCEKQMFRHEINPGIKGQHMVKHYAFFKAPDYSSMNELFNGFHWTTRPLLPTDAFLEKQIWAEDFQQNLRKAIEFGLKGHKTSWQRQDFTFKFTPISETYFASYTQTLCRQGILEWSANNFENLAPLVYDQIYCQIGPQHEWLPITR